MNTVIIAFSVYFMGIVFYNLFLMFFGVFKAIKGDEPSIASYFSKNYLHPFEPVIYIFVRIFIYLKGSKLIPQKIRYTKPDWSKEEQEFHDELLNCFKLFKSSEEREFQLAHEKIIALKNFNLNRLINSLSNFLKKNFRHLKSSGAFKYVMKSLAGLGSPGCQVVVKCIADPEAKNALLEIGENGFGAIVNGLGKKRWVGRRRNRAIDDSILVQEFIIEIGQPILPCLEEGLCHADYQISGNSKFCINEIMNNAKKNMHQDKLNWQERYSQFTDLELSRVDQGCRPIGRRIALLEELKKRDLSKRPDYVLDL